MLFSEKKERENRFFLSLKIGFPFLFLIAILSVMFYINRGEPFEKNLIPFSILFFVYIYYIFYLIYSGFKLSLIDDTTKTFSREKMESIIKDKIKQPKEHNFIILLNVENIIDINERYGLQKGDKLLYDFIELFNKFLEQYEYKNTTIGYNGGGNFLIILKGREKELTHLLNQFCHNIKTRGVDEIEVKSVFSIISSSYDAKVENVILELEERLKHKKNHDRRSIARLKIKPDEFEKIIIDAVENRNFSFKFQPVRNANTKNIDMYEVLVKLDSKKYGLLPQMQFVSVINRIGYETVYDEILIEEILKIIKDHHDEKKIFSVNISPFSLRKNMFRLKLFMLFEHYNIDPSRVILELSEKKVYKDIMRYGEIIDQVREKGYKIAIDNFGSDNASHEYIKHIHVDLVKFDIEYTKNIENKRYEVLFRSYINIFKELDIKTMIKFVEKEDIYKISKSIGVDYIQGHFVSKAISLENLYEETK